MEVKIINLSKIQQSIIDQFPVGIYYNLVDGYPYDKTGNIKKGYVSSALKRASIIYEEIFNNDNILLIYDHHCHFNEESLHFLKNSMQEYKTEKICTIKKYDEDGDIFQFNRYIFSLKSNKLKYEQLFSEIILTDIGGKYDYASSIYILHINKDLLFYLYDDRGLDLFATDIETLRPIYKKYDKWILECERNHIDLIFK